VRLSNKLVRNYEISQGLRAQRVSTSLRDRGAFNAGYEAGSRVDLHGARSSRMLR
jgi:hypothetical protein